MMVAVEERAPWQNPRILTILLLVFVAGAATGALLMRFGLHEVLHRAAGLRSTFQPAAPAPVPPVHPAQKPSPSSAHEAVLNRFQTELGLNGEQTQKLALVLDDYSQYYQSLQDQLDDLRSTGKTRIMQILDAGQREKFEKMMNDLAPQLTGAGTSSGK